MNKTDLLALMVAILHATRFDAQKFGTSEAIRDDMSVAKKIYDRAVKLFNE